nr:hypothetical protein [Mycoplasmopsis canis]WQQ12539.1 hypothetical protein RRG48_00635 [Mycoplasmopsis canis]
MRIKRLTNKDTKYLWSKEITDIFNRKFFLIVTKNATSIVDLETTITIEMRFNEINIDKSKEIIYAHQLGFLIKKDNDYYSIDQEKQISIDELKTNLEPIELPSDNNFIEEEIRKRNIEISTSSNERSAFSSYKFPKLDYVGKNKFNVSHVVDHAWWFATRKNNEEAGYLDLKFEDKPKVGICEYVALSELLLYNHLFVDSSIFNSLTWDKYIKNNRYDDDLEHSSPVFKGLNYYSSAEEKRNSLPYKLFEAADKSLNLWTSSYYWPATNSYN